MLLKTNECFNYTVHKIFSYVYSLNVMKNFTFRIVDLYKIIRLDLILNLNIYFYGKFMDLIVKDCNGNVLTDGDSVIINKTLKVKGLNGDIKQGTTVKNIRLTEDADAIEGKVNGSVVVIKTMYVKKR